MSVVNVVGGVLAVGLVAYCVAALLFADREAAPGPRSEKRTKKHGPEKF